MTWYGIDHLAGEGGLPSTHANDPYTDTTVHTRQSTLTVRRTHPLVNTSALVLVTRPALSDTYLAGSDCRFSSFSPSLISPIRSPSGNLYTYPQTSSNSSPSASNLQLQYSCPPLCAILIPFRPRFSSGFHRLPRSATRINSASPACYQSTPPHSNHPSLLCSAPSLAQEIA
ncbi:hypothetical protein DM02DRAFT_105788 [Periconia macrospinosa]|uniref:Uncharacterized protein n=1 Tax=Periconia macrospinosa TaxID=97972 RepID=A0A2V1DF85_9PLEO|nr:hypothetical protein DM02DRAFT_105788 [Periconia macrospinosa]